MTTTKSFIRGLIGENERFFIVAQCGHNKSFNAKNVNYYSVNRDRKICFTPSKNGGDPLFFTAIAKGGYLNLYVNGNLKTQDPLKITPMRNVDNSCLYAGMWYKITTNERWNLSPVAWDFLTPNFLSVSSLVGNPDYGYFAISESSSGMKPGDVCYCFLPEFFRDEKGVRCSTFDFFKKKILDNSPVTGFTISHSGNNWFEYPKWNEPQYSTGKISRGGPKKGLGKVEKPASKKHLTFSDLKNEKTSRGEPSTGGFSFPFSFFTRDASDTSNVPTSNKVSGNNGGSGDDSSFWWGMITGMIVVVILILIIYMVFGKR